MPDLENHCFAKRLAYLGRSLSTGTVWRRKAGDSFPHFKSDPLAEGRRKLRSEAQFVRECRKVLRNLPGSSDLFRSRKDGIHFGCYRGSAWLVDGRSSLALELGARFELPEQFQVLAHLAACTERVAPFRSEL